MKKKFSTSWIGSRQRRKQRKYRENAPLHIKYKFMASNLSKDLRKKLGKRNIELRKGDKVKVMRGKFSKKEGKIASVDLKLSRVTVEGLQRQKKDGTKIEVFFSPSKVQIIELGEGRRNQTKQPETKPEGENKNAQNKK